MADNGSTSEKHSKYLEKRKTLEAQVLPEFKTMIEENNLVYDKSRHTDATLLRYLRARKHNVKDAFDMFKKSLEWRESFGADKILENPSETNKNFDRLRAYWPAEYYGHDRDGVPVYYERIALVDPTTLLKCVTAEELMHYHVYCQEESARQLNEYGKKLGKPVFGNTVIEDMEGLGWRHYHKQALAILQQVIAVDEANYPELLKRYYIVNAPKFFQVLWAIVKPWLDPRTLAKIRITSGSPVNALKDDIELDQIPEQYGGTGKVTWRAHGGEFDAANDDGTTHTPVSEVVGRRSSIQVPIKVSQAGETISWIITIKAYDIGIYVQYKANEKEKAKTVLASTRHTDRVEGSYHCDKPGIYVVVIDNSYSFMRTKEVTYSVTRDVPPPADADPEALKLMAED